MAVRSGHREQHAQTLALRAYGIATRGPLNRAWSATGAASEPRRLSRADARERLEEGFVGGDYRVQ
jgi:hypothetical protein